MTLLMESLLVKKFIRIFITFTGMVITQKNNLLSFVKINIMLIGVFLKIRY